MQVGLPNVGKSTFFNILTKVGSCAGNSRSRHLPPSSPRLIFVSRGGCCYFTSGSDSVWFAVVVSVVVAQACGEEDQGWEGPQQAHAPRALSSSSFESQSWFLVRFVLLLWCGVASWPRIWCVFRLRRNNFRKEYKEKHPDVKQVSVVSALVPFRHPSASVLCCSLELLLRWVSLWILCPDLVWVGRIADWQGRWWEVEVPEWCCSVEYAQPRGSNNSISRPPSTSPCSDFQA